MVLLSPSEEVATCLQEIVINSSINIKQVIIDSITTTIIIIIITDQERLVGRFEFIKGIIIIIIGLGH